MNAIKASIEYVIKNEAKCVKTQIVIGQSASVPHISLTSAMEAYTNIFPINDNEKFVKFDKELLAVDKNENLKNLFKVLLYGETSTMSVVRKTISQVITPDVQLLYSGSGRIVSGKGKLNFGSTNTFKCLKGKLFLFKYGDLTL